MGFKTNTSGGGSSGNATVRNADSSYSNTVTCGGTLVLPNTTYDVYVNGAFNQTVTLTTLKTDTINITAI